MHISHINNIKNNINEELISNANVYDNESTFVLESSKLESAKQLIEEFLSSLLIHV
jgi:hypothetical protein